MNKLVIIIISLEVLKKSNGTILIKGNNHVPTAKYIPIIILKKYNKCNLYFITFMRYLFNYNLYIYMLRHM